MERRENNIPQQKDESLIVQMLAKYFTYWPLFVLFFVLSVVASFIYLRYSAPKYQATASLIIKDEKKGSDDSKLMESLNMINTKKIIIYLQKNWLREIRSVYYKNLPIIGKF